jgi:hypothetical protein
LASFRSNVATTSHRVLVATLFEENLEAIERAIARVCHDVRLEGPAAEDFASVARLALLKG